MFLKNNVKILRYVKIFVFADLNFSVHIKKIIYAIKSAMKSRY